MRKLFAAHYLMCIFLATGFTSLFAADETIIPGRLSWSVDSIEEIWTVDVSETSTHKTWNFITKGSESETKTIENNGTSERTEEIEKKGGGIEGEVHVGVAGGLTNGIPWVGVSGGASVSANAYARYDYTQNRNYWQSTDRTTTTGFMERKIRTEITGTDTEEKRYNRRLRVNVNFYNHGKKVLKFSPTGQIIINQGESNELLGYATPTFLANAQIRASKNACPCQFETGLNDTQKIRISDENKTSDPTIDILSGQLKIFEIGQNEDASIIHNASDPFKFVVIHPEGMREWDICTFEEEKQAFETALNSISVHCSRNKNTARLPVLFSNGNTYYFYVLDRDLLFHPWKWNPDDPARAVLVKCLPQLVKWRDDKTLDLKYLGLLAADSPLKYFQTLSALDDDEARIMLGWCHYYGVGTPKNEEEALKIWKNVAENGSETAAGLVKEVEEKTPGKHMVKTIDGARQGVSRWEWDLMRIKSR